MRHRAIGSATTTAAHSHAGSRIIVHVPGKAVHARRGFQNLRRPAANTAGARNPSARRLLAHLVISNRIGLGIRITHRICAFISANHFPLGVRGFSFTSSQRAAGK